MALRRRYHLRAGLAWWLLASTVSDAKQVAVKETILDSAVVDIQWLGTIGLTVLVKTSNGRLYRSTNGGNTWNDITDQLPAAADSSSASSSPGANIVVDKLVKSHAEPNTVMVAGTQRTHFLSINGGETWRRVRQKSTIHTWLFHKTRPKWALLSTWTDACEARSAKKKSADADGDSDDDDKKNSDTPETGPCNHMLYITKDLGRTFTLVSSYVVQFSWGDESRSQQDRIYFTHFRQKKGDQPKLTLWSPDVDFAYSDDAAKYVHRVVHHGNKFIVSHGFIFVAKLKDPASQTVNLMCSNDGGSTFRTVELPMEIDEKSYTILDTSEGAVMLHVNHGTKEPPYGVGNVYVSDQEGVRYTLSLPNNVRGSGGDCEFDKVLSLEGVYLANFKDVSRTSGASPGDDDAKASTANTASDDQENAASGTEVDKRHSPKAKSKDESVVRTVISFDKGGVWSYLKPPRVDSLGKKVDCPEDRCWLHLHGITNSNNYAPFYSIENAIGIIMGTGNIGPYLRYEPDQTNTYLSRDGGLTWVESHKGAFIYEFGDHGGLVVMADDIRKTKQVVFSWNEGISWYDFELSQTPLEVDNIVTEPNATSTTFLLYGTRGDSGVIYHMSFEALGQPLCKGVWAADSVSSDYETWMPSDGKGGDKCLLGRQVTYTRRKASAECFNGEKFERPIARKNCPCTEENFECEMGFARKVGSMECRYANDGSITPPPKCASADNFFADAHRKVVGDQCEGGWRPKRVSVPCPASAKLTRGAMSVVGTVMLIATIMGVVTMLSRSDRFKSFLGNSGMNNYGDLKYQHIGAKGPDTALDSCDFMDGEQDDFGDAPQLMTYMGERDRDRDHRDRDRYRGESEMPRRIDTAASQVPKLTKPPGGGVEPDRLGAAEDDSLDLL